MLQIGKLAKKADCLVQTVRFYESEGLLPEPARSDGNFRLYNDVHLQRSAVHPALPGQGHDTG
jgi:DNA-binding transcriptional MerR regulator